MLPSYKSINFQWIRDDSKALDILSDKRVLYHELDMPDKIGRSKLYSVHVSPGITLFGAEHCIYAPEPGKLIEMTRVSIEFHENTFWAQTVKGSRCIHSEGHSGKEYMFWPGHDLFRLERNVEITPKFESAPKVVSIFATIGSATMVSLIGAAGSDRLFSALGLNKNRTVVKQMPSTVSNLLHDSLTGSLTGKTQYMLCQAKILEYISALVVDLNIPLDEPDSETRSQKRARELHSRLSNLEGKLPSLEELSVEFGQSVQTLNNDFRAVFGKPIHSFINETRLIESHAAIETTNIPLKIISQKLGYNHCNHFISAFKKRFGYTPGSLRKN